jgi:hypothetical protein
MLAPQSNAAVALLEGVPPSLHDLADLVSYVLVLQASFALPLRRSPTGGQSDNQFGVTVDHDVRVMGDDDNLPTAFNLSELADNQLIDQVVVEIIFGLIHKQRFLPIREKEGQQGRCSLAWRAFPDRPEIPTVSCGTVLDLQRILGKPRVQPIERFGS